MRRLTCRPSTAVSGQDHCYGFISFSLQTECKSVFECNEMEGIEKLRNSRLFCRSQILFVVVQTVTRKNGRCLPVMCLSRMMHAIVDETELTIGSKMVNIRVAGKHSA